VILVASGVQLQLSGWSAGNDGGTTTALPLTGSAHAYDDILGAKDAGNWVGSMTSGQSVKLIFNGLKNTTNRVATVSLDPVDDGYLANGGLNTDPTLFEEKGHYLYAHYPVPSIMALPVTSSAVHSYNQKVGANDVRFYHNTLLTTGSAARNTYNAGSYKPNYEGWQTRFKTPFTPWIISQPVGGTEQRLFRFHALDDGQGSEDLLFAEIYNIVYPAVDGEYASFSVKIRSYGTQNDDPPSPNDQTDKTQPNPDANTLHSDNLIFTNVNLDPTSTNYIARVIGDYHRYYNFDANVNEQK
jgi:hypothetical protein